MPRIRKKTSRRKSTQERRKVQRKVSEGKKKKTKEAKANPQWKSKHKKDPGIPSDFPYKDQILAEVVEQRRLAAEERERRKQEKKLLKAGQRTDGPGHDAAEQGEEEDVGAKKLKLRIGSEEVADLSAKTISGDKLRQRNHKSIDEAEDEEEEEEEEEVPVLLNRDLPNLKAVLDEVDVLIEVLDARDPLPFRSQHLEELMAKENKRILFVLNKIDTCPREALGSWAACLREQHPTFLFRSATAFLPSALDQGYQSKGKGNALPSVSDGVGVESILGCLGAWAKGKGESGILTVGVVGLTNSGKSSFLNTLLSRRALPVYSSASASTSSPSPSTTLLPQEVVIDASGQKIRFIDTPGLTWAAGKDDALRQRDILLRSRGRIDRLKDPVPAVTDIVSRADPEDLMLSYNLPAFAKGDVTSFLSGIARSRNLVKKKGELDLNGACKIVLRDWSTGKFPRYTTPPSTVAAGIDRSLENRHDQDEAILATLKSRKDMRKQGGIVKLSPGDVECREAEVEMVYMEEDESQDGGDEGGNLEVDSDEVMEDESVSDGEPPLAKKQKRKRNAESTEVAFAHELKGTKQAIKGSVLKKTRVAPKKDASAVSAAPKNVKVSFKVANAAGSNKKAKIASDGEAYDFGKYF